MILILDLYSYDNTTNEIKSYNIVTALSMRMTSPKPIESLKDVLSPSLSIPVLPNYEICRAQVAMHMLAGIDAIAWAGENGFTVAEDDKQKVPVTKIYCRDDFMAVNRFESHGGGWGYSGHSIEAIRFMSDTDILVGGFGLFGGRGEYLGKIKVS